MFKFHGPCSDIPLSWFIISVHRAAEMVDVGLTRSPCQRDRMVNPPEQDGMTAETYLGRLICLNNSELEVGFCDAAA